MRIQTILNRVEKFKSFVYGERAPGGGGGWSRLGGSGAAAEEWSALLFRVRPPGARVRPS